ncbi:Tim44 domain-containing protein [Desulfurispira natronophila]|uniref:Putative lipid-binding transport protein (Tim44 family) n=1 Tax=Desulfurispira natronophila TaxID=682562 RepID=A0A7W7Y3P4_9BACT|nr:Tim44-like domain-containing protein [Desulfurispira natronophila]MBB5021454.1 putative lipid-binding transport protein (Tim44 family) [Desulfurispira natronophila]
MTRLPFLFAIVAIYTVTASHASTQDTSTAMSLFDLLFIGAIVFFIVRAVRGRNTTDKPPRDDWTIGNDSRSETGTTDRTSHSSAPTNITPLYETGPSHKGLIDIERSDPEFSESEFLDAAREVFNTVLQAKYNEELDQVSFLMDQAMLNQLQEDQEELHKQGKRAELSSVNIHSVSIDNAIQQMGTDCITVKFQASISSLVFDTQGEGQPQEEVNEATEYWRFMRNIGEAAWQLIGVYDADEYED